MFADGKQDVEGAVTLVTADEAYSIPIARTDLLRQGGTDDFYAEPVVVAFDKPVEVRFAFVDRIGVDGAAPAACPSVVQPVQALSSKDAAGVPSLGYIKPLHATFLQKLPALRCGASYIPPDTPRDAGGIVGRYGNVRKTTVVHVYVDSNGIPSGATVERSSGIDGLDSAAVGAVEHTRYSPARFLCTPVVSEMNVEMEYDP
jgi:TonB family protein